MTYAGDSKKHIQRVLNLCRCLEKNGFTCCMDMFDKRMEISNRQDWCAQRFSEVCKDNCDYRMFLSNHASNVLDPIYLGLNVFKIQCSCNI